jgi:pimeloyl-ACP methyl ester carboxylesterase
MDTTNQTYTTSSVTSKDGTIIGYRQLGSGPGIILVHGAVSSSQLLMKLGAALSDAFTVYIPDRRGRGLSGPFGDSYSIHKEVEDLDALLKQTDTHNIFGLSAGALISLQAALELPSIHKAALYEPPLDTDNSIMMVPSFMPRFDQEIAEGKVAEAMVTFIKNFAKQFEKKLLLLSILPRPLLARFLSLYLWIDAKNVKGDDVAFQALLPTFHVDYQLVVETKGTLENFKAVRAEVLLLGGSKCSSSMKRRLDALSEVLPNVKRVEVLGLGHEGPIDRAKPEPVVQELRRFFSAA